MLMLKEEIIKTMGNVLVSHFSQQTVLPQTSVPQVFQKTLILKKTLDNIIKQLTMPIFRFKGRKVYS